MDKADVDVIELVRMTTRSPRLSDDCDTIWSPSLKVVLVLRLYVVDVPTGPSTTIDVLESAVTMPECANESPNRCP
jgi:hypothetical protein